MDGTPRWERTAPPVAGEMRLALSRWFVQYNPLYFFSALCVLAGVFLVSGEVDALPWRTGRLRLLATLEAYSWLLVASAAFLDRVARQRRPAVLLGLVATVFLLDCTMQTEALGTLGRLGLAASFGWFPLRLAELHLLLRVFHLRVTAEARLRLSAALLLVAIGPHMVASGPEGAAWAVWACAFVVASLPRLVRMTSSAEALDAWGQIVFGRALGAVGWIGAGLCAIHAIGWAVTFGLRPRLEHFAPVVLLLSLAMEEEVLAWGGSLLALLISTAAPETLPVACVATAAALWITAARRSRPRLHVAGLLSAGAAVWSARVQGGLQPPIEPMLALPVEA